MDSLAENHPDRVAFARQFASNFHLAPDRSNAASLFHKGRKEVARFVYKQVANGWRKSSIRTFARSRDTTASISVAVVT